MWTPLQFLERKMDMKLPLLGVMEHEGGGGGGGVKEKKKKKNNPN